MDSRQITARSGCWPAAAPAASVPRRDPDENQPAVGCVYRSVAVAGTATAIHWNDSVNFTVTGSQETKIKYRGPATGSTFHDTVTCDNGLSTSQDAIY